MDKAKIRVVSCELINELLKVEANLHNKILIFIQLKGILRSKIR